MPIDISLVSSNVVITEVSGHKKGWKPMSASYEFDANNNLLLTINGQTRSIGLTDLTVSGVAPANVNAAITALAAVFLNAGGAATSTFAPLTGTSWDGSNSYKTLTSNTALTLNTGSNVSGILHVYQDGVGSRTLSINGVAFTINTAANSITGIGYYVANGIINFTVDTSLIPYTPDTTPPVVNSFTAVDSHTVQASMSESVSGTTAGWSFTQNGSTITPTAVSGTATRSFTFAETLLSTDVITASYNSVTGDTLDAAGNELVSFTGSSVTNSISGIDPDVQAWVTASGISDNTYRSYVNTFVLALKSAGIFSTHFDGLYVMCGGTDTKSRFNIINPLDTDAAYRLSFLNTPTFAATGVAFNGTNQSINSHWIGGLSTRATDADFHIAVYQRTNTDVAGFLYGVAQTATSTVMYMQPSNGAGGGGVVRTLGTSQNGFANASPKGLYITQITAATGAGSRKQWKDGTQVFTDTSNGNPDHLASVQPLYFMANNSNASIASYRAAEVSVISYGKSMTDTQRVAYQNAINQLVTSLGL